MLTIEMERPEGTRNTVILRPKGEIDEESNASFCEKLESLQKEQDANYVLLDMEGVKSVVDKAVNFLAKFHNNLASNHGLLLLFSVPPQVQDSFLQLQLSDTFEVFGGESECADFLREKTGVSFVPRKEKRSLEECAADTLALENYDMAKELQKAASTEVVTRSDVSTGQSDAEVETPVREKQRRRAAVRYYCRMRRLQTFPLVAVFSKEELDKKQLRQMGEVPPTPLKAARGQSSIEVVPRIPGSLVVPDRLSVDISSDTAAAHFWVTPVSFGRLDGWVELWRGDEKFEQIPTPAKVKKRTLPKISAVCAVLVAVAGFLWQGLQDTGAKSKLLEQLPMLEKYISRLSDANVVGLLAGIGFLVLALLFLWAGRNRDAHNSSEFFE